MNIQMSRGSTFGEIYLYEMCQSRGYVLKQTVGGIWGLADKEIQFFPICSIRVRNHQYPIEP